MHSHDTHSHDAHSNAQGTVKAAVRHLPIVVIKPLLGATRAMSKTLQGIRASVDPTLVPNASRKYK